MLDNKGIALIMTLLILVFLTVMAMNLSFSTRLGSAGARNFKEDSRAYALAVSAIEETKAYLVSDDDPKVDYLDDEGNLRTDATRPALPGTIKSDEGVVTLNLSDEDSRFNINSIRSQVLRILLETAGASDDAYDELRDTLADWIDPDSLHHLMGAEDEYYEGFGYTAKNARLNLVNELVLIKGYTPELVFGTGGNNESIHALTTTWAHTININTASERVLQMLGLDPFQIDNIMNVRTQNNGLRAVSSAFKGKGTTFSSYFRIQATARIHESPTHVKITSIIHRKLVNGRYQLRTLYWKEDIESSGT